MRFLVSLVGYFDISRDDLVQLKGLLKEHNVFISVSKVEILITGREDLETDSYVEILSSTESADPKLEYLISLLKDFVPGCERHLYLLPTRRF